MAFKLKSQTDPGDEEPKKEESPSNVSIEAGASSETKSVGLGVNYSKGSLSANAATNLGVFNRSVSGGVNYDTRKFSASLSGEKSSGQKPSVTARVLYSL